MGVGVNGYAPTVTTPDAHQRESDEADPEKQSTPAGVVRDLEKFAEEIGAHVDDPSTTGDDA